MTKPAELYVIQEPEAPVARKVLRLSAIRAHAPAEARPVDRPWPRQVVRRAFLRRVKNQPG